MFISRERYQKACGPFLLFFFIFLCSFYFEGSALAQDHFEKFFSQHPSVNLPLDHFAYGFIEKLETKGIIQPSLALRNKPFTRNAVAGIILRLEQKLKEKPDLLTRTERALLLKLEGEFHVELERVHAEIPKNEVKKHIIAFKSNADSTLTYVIGDALLDEAFDIRRSDFRRDSLNEQSSLTTVHGSARGVLKDDIAFYADFTSTLIKGSKTITKGNFSATPVGTINEANKNFYALRSDAYLVIQPKWFRLQFGKDRLVLGPGKHSNLLLSDNAPSFSNVRLDVAFERLKFTHMHGWLRSEPKRFGPDSSVSGQKYIVAHRLEFKVFPWLFLAGNESVIYGGRGLETLYLNPIMVYHIAEQYAGDKDNNQISFDATLFPAPRLKIYSALFLDDYVLTRNPFTYWKQTWAFQFGLYYVEPFHLSDVDFRFEYSRVEPFTYAHKYSLLTYSHFDVGLGSFLQPNSDDYFFEIRYQPLRKIVLTANYEYTRHGDGDIYTSGESLGYVYGTSGKHTKKFLMGTRELKHIIGVNFQYETFQHQYFSCNYNFVHAANFQNVKSQSIDKHQILVGYRIDY